MDNADIGARAFVGTNSFVRSGFVVPARHLAAGSPAVVRRELNEAELVWKTYGTRVYQQLAQDCLCSCTRTPASALCRRIRTRPRSVPLRPCPARGVHGSTRSTNRSSNSSASVAQSPAASGRPSRWPTSLNKRSRGKTRSIARYTATLGPLRSSRQRGDYGV
ncbi:hypothetical protein NKH18_51000 [Streptomyces sp. M10(2022)]